MHWWEEYPLRMIQTNLREIDMEDINAKKFAQDLADFGANAVTLNTGGILASYDTELDYHKKSEYLHGDSLGMIIDECHERGIRVIARMDFSKVRYEVYAKHPEWAYRTAAGEIVNYNGDVHVCPNSDYQQKYSLEILKEVLHRFPFDGVFCNMSGFLVVDYSGNYYGPCHCENCQRTFREKYGAELPEKDDPRNPDYKKYTMFKSECMKTQKMNLCRTIRDINPEIAIDGVDYMRVESNTEIGVEKWVYSASSNGRKIRGLANRRMADSVAVDFMGFRYRDSSVSPWQMELRQWQNLANAGTTSLYIMGRLDNHKDRSSFAGTRKVFQFQKEHEELYQGVTSAAETVLIHKNLLARFDKETNGWIRALTECHIPFDEIRQAELKEAGQLAGKKVAILCDAKFLNEQQTAVLDAFAAQGGTVLVTGDTGAFTHSFELRETFPLKCMGVEKILEKKKGLMSSVFFAGEDEKENFPSCADAPYIAFGEELVIAEFKDGVKRYLKMIPEHPFGPPERCYYTEILDHPGVTVYPYGEGKGVYMPWLAGTFYFDEGFQNTLNVMKDVLVQLCGAVQAAPDLSPMVEVTFKRKGDKRIVHLVNTSGCFANSFFPPIPVHAIRIELPDIQEGRTARAFNGGAADLKYEDGKAVLTVNRLEAYEVIEIE